MQLGRLADVSRQVAETRSRLKKRSLLAECLREAGSPGEAELAVRYLSGTLPQGRIGLGYGMLRGLTLGPRDPDGPRLTVTEVDTAFEALAGTTGKGSRQAREALLEALFTRASAPERDFLTRLILGELRQGALEGVLVDAVADAAALPAADVRRAAMVAGDTATVAAAALAEGAAALTRFRLEPMMPVQPMLAQPAADVEEALRILGKAAFEWKLDGARVQIHRLGGDVRIFTRRLHDVTARLPEVVEAVLALPAARLIVDGEVIALREDASPHPFQVTMRRFGRRRDAEDLRASLPLSVFVFDCLHLEGDDLIDRPYLERAARLAEAVPDHLRIPQIVTGDAATAARFLAETLALGHEGLMAKSLDSPYAAGSRGAGWLKLKQAHTLDLVVLAAEWGSGRRQGWLSNLHLGARDPDTGGFVMLGKTFKGLTDAMLQWQTQRLLALEERREGHVVHVRPELVVEIAVNEIQTSPHYPAGLALRFARVKGYREDKRPEEADTVDTVRRLR